MLQPHPAGFRAAAFAVAFALLSAAALADGPQPAQKDSPPRAKPKDAEVTAVIEPAEARPGEVVKLKVRVKLKPGWHIYTFAEEQREEGPRHTLFDAFDLGGLEKSGSWKASKAPESRAEPAFDNKVFEYFEDEVEWALELKVPADAAPGKKSVRIQASYQICDAQSCSFPGRWTLPEATVTVVGGRAAATPAPEATPSEPAASAAGPKKKDTPERIRPKGIEIATSIEPSEAAAGGTVNYKVAVKLNPGLHIYNLAKPGAGDDGPVPTSFDLFDAGGLSTGGAWKPSREPTLKPEPAFGDNVIVEFFEDQAEWTITLTVPPDATPGEHAVRSQINYQICNENSCFPPTYQTLPPAIVKVGGVAAAIAHAGATTPPAATTAPAEPVHETSPIATTSSSPPGPAPAALQPAEAPAASPVQGGPTDQLVRPASGDVVAGAAPAEVQLSEIARTSQRGIIPFLIASALGGLFALVMPCVWPMIPITVNFFVKQGKDGKAGTTGLAFAYCLSIIGIFTLVGVVFSAAFSAAFLQNLANNPWLNLVVAGLFLAFGLSLLGLFEVSLPSFLLNASAQGESRGGLIGVVFMALTLTITSFTCTFPVVGGLLVMAANGDRLYPILGLATFASVVALPFFLLALAPGLLSRMPRSGDWMNSVKVVGGLVEIGAALKFLNTAELGYVTPENAWFDAQVVLTAWIVLSAVCGVYLLGFFRTDHDYDEVKVGPGRIVFGSLFLGLALYMAPALFGRPPQSLVWDRMIVGILPPDAGELKAETYVAAGGEALAEVKASSTEPAQAEREQKQLHGVLWGMSLEQAKEEAAAKNRPILIDFTGVNCANCRLMEANVLPKPDIVKLLKEFVTIQLYTDRVPINSLTAAQREELAMRNQERQLDLAAEQTNPFYVILSPDGKVVSSIGGYNEPGVFQDFLVKALDKARGASRVAQASGL